MNSKARFLLNLFMVEVSSIIISAGIGFVQGVISFSPEGIEAVGKISFVCSAFGALAGAPLGLLTFGLLYNRAVSFIDFCYLISVVLLSGIVVAAALIVILSGQPGFLSMFFTPPIALIGILYLRFHRPRILGPENLSGIAQESS
jgi:hypothetical protein